jgi:hypothetical protein
MDHAVERVAAAAETVRGLGFPFMLTARAKNHIRGNPDLEDTIRRLLAFEEAGTDVLYAPGIRTTEEIRITPFLVSPYRSLVTTEMPSRRPPSAARRPLSRTRSGDERVANTAAQASIRKPTGGAIRWQLLLARERVAPTPVHCGGRGPRGRAVWWRRGRCRGGREGGETLPPD